VRTTSTSPSAVAAAPTIVRARRPQAWKLLGGLFAIIAVQAAFLARSRPPDAPAPRPAAADAWRDAATGLRWYAPPPPPGARSREVFSYREARDFCGGLRDGGAAAGDWRLPTAAEVATAAGNGAARCVASDRDLPGTRPEARGPWLWCSDSGTMTWAVSGRSAPTRVWASLSTGRRRAIATRNSRGDTRLLYQNVACVRGVDQASENPYKKTR
jgi:hypothetical protein